MKAKILLALVLLALFSANVFAAACPGTAYYTADCQNKTQAVCSDFYEVYQPTSAPGGGGRNCEWRTPVPQCAGMGGACAFNCTVVGRQTTSDCGNKNSAVCADFYETAGGGETSHICMWFSYSEPYTCIPEAACPEFFGIEFGEMSLSGGIIALVAAIALPSILFRKKR